MSFGQACIWRLSPSRGDEERSEPQPASPSSVGSPEVEKNGGGISPVAADNVFSERLDLLSRELDRRISADKIISGRFARAYVDLILSERHGCGLGIAQEQSFTMMRQPQLYALWSDWLMQCLERHIETRHEPQLSMIHHAAVGLWLAVFMADAANVTNEAELRHRMLRLLPW